MRTLPVIAHLWSMLALGASEDGGIPAQSRGVADAISRSSRKKDSITDAYAEALSEVIANLKRTLDR